MNEYKFRGRRLDNGEWVHGSLLTSYGKAYIVNGCETTCLDGEGTDLYALEWYEVSPATVGQYTGLKDKNGVEICEGDIVKENRYEWISAYEVVYDDGAYKLRLLPGRELFRPFSHRNVVIGNIHDNPELLGGGHD